MKRFKSPQPALEKIVIETFMNGACYDLAEFLLSGMPDGSVLVATGVMQGTPYGTRYRYKNGADAVEALSHVEARHPDGTFIDIRGSSMYVGALDVDGEFDVIDYASTKVVFSRVHAAAFKYSRNSDLLDQLTKIIEEHINDYRSNAEL